MLPGWRHGSETLVLGEASRSRYPAATPAPAFLRRNTHSCRVPTERRSMEATERKRRVPEHEARWAEILKALEELERLIQQQHPGTRISW